MRSLGDNKPVDKPKDELEAIKKELAEAKSVIEHHLKAINKVAEYNLSTKSDKLKNDILKENKQHPEYAPINNVYSFQLGDVSITLGYLLWVVGKIKRYGAHQIEYLLEIHNKWDDVNRMLNAYSDMIDAKDS